MLVHIGMLAWSSRSYSCCRNTHILGVRFWALMILVVQLLTLELTLLDSRAFVGVPMVDRGFQVLQSPADLVVLNLGHLQET